MSTPTMGTKRTITDDALIDLALQGGGAHGAFTWGVLDRLLEEKQLRIDGISGTSAGAMNAAALAQAFDQLRPALHPDACPRHPLGPG
jgi:NTE family protein